MSEQAPAHVDALTPVAEGFDFDVAARKLSAAGYGISERYIREHIGEFPHIKIGNRVRFTDELLREYLEQRTRRPAARADRLQPAGGRRRRSA